MLLNLSLFSFSILIHFYPRGKKYCYTFSLLKYAIMLHLRIIPRIFILTHSYIQNLQPKKMFKYFLVLPLSVLNPSCEWRVKASYPLIEGGNGTVMGCARSGFGESFKAWHRTKNQEYRMKGTNTPVNLSKALWCHQVIMQILQIPGEVEGKKTIPENRLKLQNIWGTSIHHSYTWPIKYKELKSFMAM